jgi:death-on-curing family protein
MMQEKRTFQPVPPNSVCQIYELLHNSGLVSFPLTVSALDKLEAIVATVTNTYYGHEIYSTIEEKVVAYLYFLIKDHPFTDGNKRTATLVFSVLCELNDLNPSLGNKNPTLDELAVFIEKIQEDDHQSVIKQIAELIFMK